MGDSQASLQSGRRFSFHNQEEIQNGANISTIQDLNFFSSFIKDFSKDMPFFYGLFSIMFAVFLGIGAAFVRRAISKFRKKYFMKPAK